MISKTPLAAFTQKCHVQVPNVPDLIAQFHVRNAAIQFCQRTQCVKDVITLDLDPCVGDYYLDQTDPDYCVYAVESVLCGGTPLDPERNGTLAAGYHFVAPDRLFIKPVSGRPVEDGLEVNVALTPTPDAVELPTILYTHWAEAIADGALCQIYKMTDADWYDPRQSGVHYKAFTNAMSRVRHISVRHHSTGPVVLRPARRFV